MNENENDRLLGALIKKPKNKSYQYEITVINNQDQEQATQAIKFYDDYTINLKLSGRFVCIVAPQPKVKTHQSTHSHVVLLIKVHGLIKKFKSDVVDKYFR